jgi:hypothetical protein
VSPSRGKEKQRDNKALDCQLADKEAKKKAAGLPLPGAALAAWFSFLRRSPPAASSFGRPLLLVYEVLVLFSIKRYFKLFRMIAFFQALNSPNSPFCSGHGSARSRLREICRLACPLLRFLFQMFF